MSTITLVALFETSREERVDTEFESWISGTFKSAFPGIYCFSYSLP